MLLVWMFPTTIFPNIIKIMYTCILLVIPPFTSTQKLNKYCIWQLLLSPVCRFKTAVARWHFCWCDEWIDSPNRVEVPASFFGCWDGQEVAGGWTYSYLATQTWLLTRHDLKIHKTNIKPSEMTYQQCWLYIMIPVCFQSWVFFLFSQPCFCHKSFVGCFHFPLGSLLDQLVKQ